MLTSRNKLYLVLAVACFSGYAWLSYNLFYRRDYKTSARQDEILVCPIKHMTGIPCPSCGTTRSIISLSRGDLMSALHLNPFGILVGFMMLVLPLWMIFDLLAKKCSLRNTYQKAEVLLKKRRIAIPLILIVLINWAWNIYKNT